MHRNVFDFRSFYRTLQGRVVRRVLNTRIAEFWNRHDRLRYVGLGYAAPYLSTYLEGAQNVSNFMPSFLGVHHWPSGVPNLTALCDIHHLPLESASIDRLLVVHGLEFSANVLHDLHEIGRVLKSQGRLLAIVPSRTGAWTRAEHTPFGLGAPFSSQQISNALRESGFVIERIKPALFVPPLGINYLYRSAMQIERSGARFLPFMGSVFIIEASKNVYARIGTDKGTAVPVQSRPMFASRPVPASSCRESVH
jgi:SAM-dependent methyltransferase